MPPVAAAVSPVRKSRVEKHGRELAGRLGRPPTARVRRRTQRKPRRRQGAHHPRHTQKPRRQPKARRSGKDRNKTKQPLRSQDRRGFLISYIVCRSDRIRTCDPLVPNQIRYRTALHSERRGFRRNFNKKADHPIEQSADLSGRLDSNQRPPTPEAGALTGLRYTPNIWGSYRFKSAQR